MGKRLCRVLLAAALLLGLGRYRSGLSAEPWKAQWERVAAAARQEGKVTIYAGGPGAGGDRRKVYQDHFEAAFPGIKVDYVPTPSGTADSRLVAERRAGKYLPDLYLSGVGSSTAAILKAQGAYQSLRPSLILPELLDESKWFEGRFWFADSEEKFIFMYSLASGTLIAVNTQLVKPEEITSYKQLLDPKWRGKIVSHDITGGGVGGSHIKFLYVNPHLGPGFLKKLYGEMDITLSRDPRQMIDWLAQGKYAILIFPGLNDVDNARKVSLPVDVIPSQQMVEGYPLTPGGNTLVLLNPAPHPNAAKVFINWFLSREGQTAFERVMATPSLRFDTPTKGTLRGFLVPKTGTNYMIMVLERYWHLDAEINQLLKSVRK